MGVRERELYFLFKWLWGPDDQIMEIETSRPESPGHWPEYPGVTSSGSKFSKEWNGAWFNIVRKRADGLAEPVYEKP